ncbi:uncharacterized protein LOC134829283 [Culicoides brevitarsis]|uniref:uncharacterized protein LOC134829283 n=1 Tax=Culicoides brevitarsis TaxID=469753 RepID=UPI00307B792F
MLSRSRIFVLLASAALISTASGTRCYRCHESGYIGDVRNCRDTVECRYGCKITQVVSHSREIYVEQDCYEMTYPFGVGSSNNDNVNPTYIPQTQYQSNYPQTNFPRQNPPIIFNPHNPDNRDYAAGYDNTNLAINNNQYGQGSCSTYSAIQAFRRLFPYSSGYSATCNTCDWDYCNLFNAAPGLKATTTIGVVLFVLLKSFM